MKKNVLSGEQLMAAVVTGVVVAIVIFLLKYGAGKIAETSKR